MARRNEARQRMGAPREGLSRGPPGSERSLSPGPSAPSFPPLRASRQVEAEGRPAHAPLPGEDVEIDPRAVSRYLADRRSSSSAGPGEKGVRIHLEAMARGAMQGSGR
eukprot:7531707-Pyramimonas_sp.AAC.1